MIVTSMPRDPYKLYPQDYVLRATLLRLIPSAVTPNHITVLRMMLTPVVLYLLATGIWCLVCRCLCSLRLRTWSTAVWRACANILPVGNSVRPDCRQTPHWPCRTHVCAQVLPPDYCHYRRSLRPHPACYLACARKRESRRDDGEYVGKMKMMLQFVSLTMLLLAVVLQLPFLADVGEWTLVLATVFAAVATITYSL